MTSLGEIVLKFGASGAAGEEPLRFMAAHINLVVGPNNAGKSLMLREISGVNPRVKKRRIEWESAEYPPTRLVEAVHWNEVAAQPLRQEIVDENFPAGDRLWAELKARSWYRLVPGLEHAATEIESIRDRLCATLVEQARATFWSWNMFASHDYWSDAKQCAPLVVSGALILLNQHHLDGLAGVDGGSNAENLGPKPPGERLTREQAVAMQQAFQEAGRRLAPVLQSLGIETHGISVAQLIDPTAFGAAFLTAISADPLFRGIILTQKDLAQLPRASDEETERATRLILLTRWLLDPQSLRQLAKKLNDAYASQTWENYARREHMAKQVLYLDGMARLSVTRSADLKAFGDKDGDQPAILALLKQPEAMEELRELTADALDAYLVIDMATRSPKVIWRLAQEKPPEGIETSYTAEAHQFHEAASRLDERSDGIHAFVGMIAAILAKPIDLVFIDEPEAFLHAPLVRKLARQLAYLALDADKQFFIATHSADLLESFVASGAEVNIIRLTHDSTRSTARLLNSVELRHLARDPLLRSEATLSALFHEGAVICEAAGDRVLYREINERLLDDDDDDALESCVFLNAQNWDTVRRMMAPLRRMGVAAAAIVDADVLFEPGLTLLLDAAQVDKETRDGWLKLRNGLREKIAKRLGVDLGGADAANEAEPGKDKKKLSFKGKLIAELKPVEKKLFTHLLAYMAEYGVFLVPVGELEDWLTPLGLRPPSDRAMKGKWLREALDRLGQDPRSESYVRPEKGDIWDFMRRVNAWILDPDREGTSSTTQVNNEGSRTS